MRVAEVARAAESRMAAGTAEAIPQQFLMLLAIRFTRNPFIRSLLTRSLPTHNLFIRSL